MLAEVLSLSVRRYLRPTSVQSLLSVGCCQLVTILAPATGSSSPSPLTDTGRQTRVRELLTATARERERTTDGGLYTSVKGLNILGTEDKDSMIPKGVLGVNNNRDMWSGLSETSKRQDPIVLVRLEHI